MSFPYCSIIDSEMIKRSAQHASAEVARRPETTSAVVILPITGKFGGVDDPSNIRACQREVEDTFSAKGLGMSVKNATVDFSSETSWSKLRSGHHPFLWIVSNERDQKGELVSKWTASRLHNWLSINHVSMTKRSEFRKPEPCIGALRLSHQQEKAQWITGRNLWRQVVETVCQDMVFGPMPFLKIEDHIPYDCSLGFMGLDYVGSPFPNVPPLVIISLVHSENYASGKDVQTKRAVETFLFNEAFDLFKNKRLLLDEVKVDAKPEITKPRPTFSQSDYEICAVVDECLLIPEDVLTKLRSAEANFVTKHNAEFNPKGLRQVVPGKPAAKRTAETEAEDAPEAKATKTSPVENTLETIADVQREYPSIVKVESKNQAIWFTQRSDESDSKEAVFLKGLEDTVVSPKTALGSIGAGLWLEGKKAKEMMEQMSCRLNRPRHTMRLRHNTQSFRCYKNIVALHVLLLRCQVVPVHVDQRSGYGRGVGGTAD